MARFYFQTFSVLLLLASFGAETAAQDAEKQLARLLPETLQGKQPGDIDTPPRRRIDMRKLSVFFGGEPPLVVVDGMQAGADLPVDPMEIQSFQILKDDSISEKSGSQSRRGSVIISTNRDRLTVKNQEEGSCSPVLKLVTPNGTTADANRSFLASHFSREDRLQVANACDRPGVRLRCVMDTTLKNINRLLQALIPYRLQRYPFRAPSKGDFLSGYNWPYQPLTSRGYRNSTH